jgi:hypothetical protein
MKKYSIWKIRKGKKKLWIAWCNEIMQRKEEALSTLREEYLIYERCVIFQDFVVYEHQPVEGKIKQPMNLKKAINKKHSQMVTECLARLANEPVIVGYELQIYN